MIKGLKNLLQMRLQYQLSFNILGIIWYKVSERQGNILDFMKLSLEANLLPKTHAAGGYADIIYEYEACTSYPKNIHYCLKQPLQMEIIKEEWKWSLFQDI